MNKVQLLGRIGKTLELRHMPNGDAVLNITLATDKEWTDKGTQEKKKKTEWHRLVAFKHTAELISNYYQKGDIFFAEGELGTRKWTDGQGQDQYTTEITVQQLDFSLNSMLVIGNVGVDLVLRDMPNGGKVLNFTVASKKTWKNKQTQQKEEKTEWHSVVAFNKQAEIIAKHFNKGSKIVVEGELQTQKWTPEGGKEQCKTEIKLNNFHFASNKKAPTQQPTPAPVDQQIPQTGFSQDQPSFAQQQTDFGQPQPNIQNHQEPKVPDFVHTGFDDYDDELPM